VETALLKLKGTGWTRSTWSRYFNSESRATFRSEYLPQPDALLTTTLFQLPGWPDHTLRSGHWIYWSSVRKPISSSELVTFMESQVEELITKARIAADFYMLTTLKMDQGVLDLGHGVIDE